MALDFYGLDLVVASNIGTIKHVKYNSNPNKKPHEKQLQSVRDLEKGDGVVCATWADVDQTKFVVGRKNNNVQTYDLVTENLVESKRVDFGDKFRIRSVSTFDDFVIAAGNSGAVRIWKPNAPDELLLNAGENLEKMKLCPVDRNVIATGGKENDLKLWDMEKKKCTFQAKNVAHDWLQLRVPVWVADCCFLPEDSGKLIAACSRYGTVRLYDARTQRRPVCNVEFKDQAVVCISPGHHDKHVIVGTGRGLMNLVDLRMTGKLSKSYKGAVGAVTDIVCHKERNLVISTSLDRHLRIHNSEKKNVILKQYLTSKLTCFLLRTADSFLKYDEDDEIKVKEEIEESEIKEEVSDDEYDDLFDNMEVIEDNVDTSKRKKTNKNQEEAGLIKNKSKSKKRKIDENDMGGSSIVEKLNETKKTKVEENTKEEDDSDVDARIRRLLKNTEKLKRQLLNQKKKKKSKSLFYK